MAVPGTLPFQYAIRGDGLSTDLAVVRYHDQRDRDLEDFLNNLAAWVGYTPGIGGGGSGAGVAGYFFAPMVSGGVAAGATTVGTFGAAYESNGFTNQGGTITCVTPGRYNCQLHWSVAITANLTFSIAHIKQFRGGSLIREIQSVDASGNTGWYVGVEAEGILNLLAGDTITASITLQNTGTVDGRSFFVATPVGGIKGDKGDPGNAALAYWFSSFSGPATITGGAGKVQLTPNDALAGQQLGFHRHANGTVVVCDIAGMYRIGVHVTESILAGAAVGYSDTYIEVRDPNNFTTVMAQANPVGGGMVNTIQYFTSDGELVCNLRAGDMVTVYVAADSSRTFQASRSYISIIPVGGPQGPVGAQGPPGNAAGTSAWVAFPFAAGWSNYGAGYQACQYRLEGDRVFLRGLAQQTVLGNTVVANMPAGTRPPNIVLLHTLSFSATPKDHIQRLDINTLGALTMAAPAVSEVQQYLTLDGMSWSTAA